MTAILDQAKEACNRLESSAGDLENISQQCAAGAEEGVRSATGHANAGDVNSFMQQLASGIEEMSATIRGVAEDSQKRNESCPKTAKNWQQMPSAPLKNWALALKKSVR